MSREVIVDGREFKSIADVCRHYGLSCPMVRERLKHGWSLEEALGLSKRDLGRYNIAINGVCFSNLKEACSYFSVSYSTVCSKMKLWGYNAEETINFYVGNKNIHKKIYVQGVEFPSLSSACKYYNICYSKVRNSLKYGWSLEEALRVVPRLVGTGSDKVNYNRCNLSVRIVKVLSSNLYKCTENDTTRYYSKEELIKIYQEEKQISLETTSPTQ